MKTCTVPAVKAGGGWHIHAAWCSYIGLLIRGISLKVVGILFHYLEDLAEIGPRTGIRWVKERKNPRHRRGNLAKVWKEPTVSIYVGVTLAIILASAVRIWLDH